MLGIHNARVASVCVFVVVSVCCDSMANVFYEKETLNWNAYLMR